MFFRDFGVRPVEEMAAFTMAAGITAALRIFKNRCYAFF